MANTDIDQNRIASLDGLRAIAILIVLVAHADLEHIIPGGFGVTIFFFLSGYLITTLLQREAARTGTISISNFFRRRFLRLMPPLIVTLLCAYTLAELGLIEGTGLSSATISHLFYFHNYYLLAETSAGEGVPGLGILWSLAIEEHFYLLYPALFLLLWKLKKAQTGLVILGTILLAVLIWRIVLVVGYDATIKRIYLGTDTRIDSILFGCFLAFWQATGHTDKIFPRSFWPMTMILIVGGIILLGTFLWRDEIFRMTIRYSIQGLALFPIFFYAVTMPSAIYFRPLNRPITKQLATWSYTIYLCHDVIYNGLRQYEVAGNNPLVHIPIVLLISCLFAQAVHQWIEVPLGQFRFGRPALPHTL